MPFGMRRMTKASFVREKSRMLCTWVCSVRSKAPLSERNKWFLTTLCFPRLRGMCLCSVLNIPGG